MWPARLFESSIRSVPSDWDNRFHFSFQAGGVFSRDMKKGGKINPTTTYVKFGILGSSPYQSTLNALPTVHLCDTVPRSIFLYYVFLVSSIGGLYHFEKRCHFAASPATGLVGMAENYFLSDYFDCMGLIPLATRRQGRGSTVLWTYSLRTSFPLSKWENLNQNEILWMREGIPDADKTVTSEPRYESPSSKREMNPWQANCMCHTI